MTFVAGTPLSAADLNDALASDSPTNFTTTSPAGSGWYRFLLGGALVQVHWNSSAAVAASTTVTPDYVLPAAYRPATRVAAAAVAGASGATLSSAAFDADGTWSVRNGHTSSTVITVDALFSPA